MKFILRMIAVALITLTALFVLAFVVVRANGKQMVTGKLASAFHRNVTIEHISVVYPLGIRIQNLFIDGYGSIKEIDIGFGVFYLFQKNLTFSTLVLTEPKITVRRLQDFAIVLGDAPKPESDLTQGQPNDAPGAVLDSQGAVAAIQAPNVPAKKEIRTESPIKLVVNYLVVNDGAVSFVDQSSDKVLQFTVDHINLRARNVAFSNDSRDTKFDFTASLAGAGEESSAGHLEGRGWLNVAQRNMKASFKLAGLNGGAFLPFYQKAMGDKIQDIKADLSADLESKNNDMTVKGSLQVKDFSSKKEGGEDKGDISVEDLIMSGLKSIAKEISIDFGFKTKMDRFKVESISFSGNIFDQSFAVQPSPAPTQ